MLKNKRAVRRLALLVCLSLIVGLLPIGMMSVPVEVNAVPSEAVNLLSNGDFENGTDGWVNAQLNANEGRTGNALQIDSKVKGKDIETAAASRTAVAAGASCEFSFYAKRDAADASGKKITAYVLWYDASGAYMTGKANYWNIGPGTDWELYQYSVTAPAGAAAAAVRFYGSSNFDGIVYVDDVAFAALNSSEPADTEPTQATEATEAASDNLMTNGDFEDGLTGWPSSPVLSACTEDKHSGAASLKFTDNNGTAGGPYFQQVVPVKAGKTYKLSAWVKVLGGNTGYFGVYGIGSASKQLAFGEVVEWKQVEITVTIPSDKTEAKIEIGANSGSDVTYLIDDMVFAEVASSEPDPTVATEATVPTESTGATEGSDPTESSAATEPGCVFQDFLDGSAIPDVSVEQWKESNGGEESVLEKESGTYKVGRGANNKLVFQSPEKDVRYYAVSPVFAVNGGMTYTVKFQSSWYFSSNSESNLELVFVDASGKVLATETGDAYSKKAVESVWADMSMSAVAPEAATGAYLKFNYCVTSGNNNYWVRNLMVNESETVIVPTEPFDPNLMLSDKFEIFANADDANSGPLGWYSSDDSGSVYSIAIACEQRNTIKHDGYYLLLQMVGNWTIQSADFDVKPGYEYTADFLARKLVDNENFNGYLTICFVDMFGLPLQADKATVGKTYGKWEAESVKAIAPAGAVKAYLVFGLDNDSRSVKADYAIDNLKVTQSAEPAIELEEVPVVPTRPVYEDSFDEAYTPEGSSTSVRIPVGWTASQKSAAMACSKYDDYDGTNNLCLQNTDDKWIRSPLIDAVPGNTYTALFMEKKLNPAVIASGGYVKIVFVDEEEAILSEATKAIGVASKWTLNGVQALAPEGAAKLYVEFGIAKHTGGTPSFCVENLQVVEADGDLTASEGTTPDDGTTPDNGTTPPSGDGNASTGDDAALLTVSTMLVAVVALAVLVIKKRKFF